MKGAEVFIYGVKFTNTWRVKRKKQSLNKLFLGRSHGIVTFFLKQEL